MKRSTVTWRLHFTTHPNEEGIDAVRALLEPIIRVEKPADFGKVQQECGTSGLLFIEAEAERSAGEIALNCLQKAHRIARGWSVMWPGFPKAGETGWTAGDVGRALLPEYLDGLTGSFTDTSSMARSLIQGLQSASFTVAVSPEAMMPVPGIKPSQPAVPTGRPAPPGESAVRVLAILGKLLIAHRATSWKWDQKGARSQLEQAGFRLAGEEYEEWIFSGPDGITARIAGPDDAVRWIEFILSSCPDPHLLDESVFAEKQQEYEDLFHQAVAYARALLGPPLFQGASGDVGFPEDQWADWAAVWPSSEGRIMIQQKHNDKETPLELCLVFAPPV